jgi:hypothetical protein
LRRTNYKHEKRQIDLDKLRKKEEKKQRKLERKGLGTDSSSEAAPEQSDAGSSPNPES